MNPTDPRSQRERMLAGDLYIAADPELTAEGLKAARMVESYNRTTIDEPEERRRILTALLGTCGEDIVIRPPFYCDYGYQIHIGPRTFINFGLIALDVGTITIGADVQIAPRVQLLAATHPLEPEPRREKWESGRPIVIEDNVWLGGGVIVCPGVRIGENTVVGAGAVVVKDLPPNVIAVGNPARVLCSIA